MRDVHDASLLTDEPFEPEVLQSDLVYEGRVWDVRSDRVRYGDGEIVRQYVDHTGAVAVVDQFPNAEVLCTRTEYEWAHAPDYRARVRTSRLREAGCPVGAARGVRRRLGYLR